MKSLLVLLSLILAVATASATGVNQIIVFGDSLSDTGNFRDSNPTGYPSPVYNYTSGRFTDGRTTSPSTKNFTGVWHEQLAPLIGLSAATNSKGGGLNYAYGAATTDDTDENIQIIPGVNARIENLGSQVRQYLSNHTPASTDLILVWAGANDLLDGTATPQEAVTNIDTNLRRLIDGGGRVFLIPNLPPLGDTPEGKSEGKAAAKALNQATVDYNAALASDLSALIAEEAQNSVSIQFITPDVYNIFLQIEKKPSRFGLKNVTKPSQGSNGVNPDTYLYWDTLHPTTKGHNILAQLAASLLNR